MNFYGEDIGEYKEMVGTLSGMWTYTYAPKKLDFDLKNR